MILNRQLTDDEKANQLNAANWYCEVDGSTWHGPGGIICLSLDVAWNVYRMGGGT